MVRVVHFELVLPVVLFLSLLQNTLFGNCNNAWVVPRLVAGEFNGVVFVPSLTFKNLSDKQCDGRFYLLEGDSELAPGQFEFNGKTLVDGAIEISLEPGEGLFAKLRKIDSAGYQGYGIWHQDGNCLAGEDLVLTADMQLATLLEDGSYEVIDQIGISTGFNPQQGWGFPVRRITLPPNVGVESTAFSLTPCQEGPYEWTVEFFDHSGAGQLSQKGSSIGPMAKFIDEIFASELPRAFTGYATVSVDEPAYLEALTVVSGPRIQGGVQLSNFPIQLTAESPHTKHAFAVQLQTALDQVISDHDIMGVSAAVMMPGQPVWTGVSGNSTPTEPLSLEMLFGIASVTKMFTAALTLQLVDEGVLQLEDPLSRWLPEFPNVDSRITIRQLLNHTSGLYNYEFNPALVDAVFADPDKSWTPEEILSYVGPPSFQPGAGWQYSNTNYILLGMIVQRVTGNDVSEEFRRRFFTPLGLSATTLGTEETGELAHNWSDWDRNGAYEDISLVRTSLYSVTWTTAGLVSNAGDLVRWTDSLFEGNVLSRKRLDKMLEFHPIEPAIAGVITGYGLGVQEVKLHGRTFWGHGGNMPGWNSMLLYEPNLRLKIAILFNQDGVSFEAQAALVEALLNAVQPGLNFAISG